MESALHEIAPKGLEVIETFGFTPDDGFVRLGAHVDRLQSTCDRLRFPFERGAVLMTLGEAVDDVAVRVRVAVNSGGEVSVQVGDMVPVDRWRVGISDVVLRSDDPWLLVKTSNRAVYDDARTGLTDLDEVLFLNERGEVCEGTITNVFADLGDGLVTPPVSSGCLPGVLRGEMLATGQAVEGVLTLDVLRGAKALFVGNSLRGLIEVVCGVPMKTRY
jgi:branched-subunit amino acid aminotransferase/4-amino-4-deoxychorismate lyase